MKYKIEKGVPMPPKRNNAKSKWYRLAMAMKVGDSVLVSGKGEANSLTYIIRYYGNKATHMRQRNDRYRVWKDIPDGVIGNTSRSGRGESWFDSRSGKPARGRPLSRRFCKWTYEDIDDYYDGTCGICWSFNEGGLKENKVIFCPKCGKRIKEVKNV